MAVRRILETTNYRQFVRIEGKNRTIDVKKHKRLKDSMERFGFLWCYPIVCYRDKDNRLVLKEGQHRLIIAEALGLPVYWVETDQDFDVAVVNSAAKIWVLKDYACQHVANGLTAYAEGLDFAEQHELPI